MATELIAVGEGATNSADIVVAAGSPVTVGIKDAAGPDPQSNSQVDILLKDDAGQYFKVGDLRSGVQVRSTVLIGPGTYRLSRTADSASCGAFSA